MCFAALLLGCGRVSSDGDADQACSANLPPEELAAILAAFEEQKLAAFSSNDFAALPAIQAHIDAYKKKGELDAAVRGLEEQKAAEFEANNFAALPALQAEISQLQASMPELPERPKGAPKPAAAPAAASAPEPEPATARSAPPGGGKNKRKAGRPGSALTALAGANLTSALALGFSNFGANTWRPPLMTFETIAEKKRGQWWEQLNSNGPKTENMDKHSVYDKSVVKFFQKCLKSFPEFDRTHVWNKLKNHGRMPSRLKCGYALATYLSFHGYLAEAAVAYSRVAGLLELPPEDARWVPARVWNTSGYAPQMNAAMYFNVYLVLLWRLGEHAAYDAAFVVAKQVLPWTHPYQIARATP
eukprot:SAG22_NODE_3150_length_1902_cov_2.588464_1_plen_359_part_00